jgi:hypothetical protein
LSGVACSDHEYRIASRVLQKLCMSQIHGSQQRPAIVQFIARYPADGLSAGGDVHAD